MVKAHEHANTTYANGGKANLNSGEETETVVRDQSSG